MKIKRFILLTLAVCMIVSCFSACGNAEKDPFSEIMLSKYYISSPENEDAEFAADFERRLVWLAYEGFGGQVSYGENDCLELMEACRSGAQANGIPLGECAVSMGLRAPGYIEYAPNDPETPEYYLGYVRCRAQAESALNYLGGLWGIDATDTASLRSAVMEYCRENSKTVYGTGKADRVLARGRVRDSLTANNGPGVEIYLAGENGYAAVYTKAPELLDRDTLSANCGTPVCGSGGINCVYRFADSEGWDRLVYCGDGYLFLVKFDRWVTADSEDYDAFVAIYGAEPKLHP